MKIFVYWVKVSISDICVDCSGCISTKKYEGDKEMCNRSSSNEPSPLHITVDVQYVCYVRFWQSGKEESEPEVTH